MGPRTFGARRLVAATLGVAAALLVAVAAAQDGRFTLQDVEIEPAAIRPGETVTMRTTVTARQAVSGVSVDLEVKNASDRRVAQKVFDDQSFGAGQSRTYEWKWDVPEALPGGQYVAKVGVFDRGWGKPVAWNNDAGRVTVEASRQPSASGASAAAGRPTGTFEIDDTKIDPGRVRAGQPVRVETRVIARERADGVHVDLEIKDANNNKVAQRIFSDQRFDAGQSRTYEWRWTAPADLPAGEYTVKVGVFDRDWAELAAWDNEAGDVRVRRRGEASRRSDDRAARAENRLGVELEKADRAVARRYGLPDDVEGVVVTEVRPGSPAARAGLARGDVIREIDDRRVDEARDVDTALRRGERPREEVRLRVERDGRRRDVVVRP
jgi:hypothetical protein